MIRVTTNVLGVFALKEDRVIKKILFPENPAEIVKRLEKAGNSVCNEEIRLIKELEKTGTETIAVKNPRRFWGHGFNVKFVEEQGIINPIVIGEGIGLSKENVIELMSKVNVELTGSRLKVVDADSVVMQAINALDDIDEVLNRLIERLREWYSIYFPELDHIVDNHEIYVEMVSKLGKREKFKEKELTYDSEFVKRIVSSAEKSLGADLSDEDIGAIKKLTVPILDLYKTKNEIEEYLEESMEEIAPNISALAGPLLGARIISLAGGLRRLSILPAGTIQILGAEDAFFRFLKTGKKPPKHGIIFQLPEIRSAKRDARGKLARNLAAKLAIAAKVDFYKGSFIGDRLRNEFLSRVKKITE